MNQERTVSLSLLAHTAKEKAVTMETELHKAWEHILDDIESDPKYKDIRASISWLEEVLAKNVPFGDKSRARLTVEIYEHVVHERERTEEDNFLNFASGWIFEILNAGLLIASDVTKDSDNRNGKLSWHKVPHVVMSAVCDVFLLEYVAYCLTMKYFKGKSYVNNLHQLISEGTLKRNLGMTLDMKHVDELGHNQIEGEKNKLSRFTDQKFKTFVKYKLAYFEFYGPIAHALIRAGIPETSYHEPLKDLAQLLGELLQMHVDYAKYFGGKLDIGNPVDQIKRGNLNWLIVKAVKFGNDKQKETLADNYGSMDADSVSKVQNVYEEIGLRAVFKKESAKLRNEIVKKVNDLQGLVPVIPILSTLGRITDLVENSY